jgi:hypothetical protein
LGDPFHRLIWSPCPRSHHCILFMISLSSLISNARPATGWPNWAECHFRAISMKIYI